MRGQWIKSNRVTNFGDWGRVEYCPSGQHAIGVMVKYEEIGSTNDHTGINGIALLCAFRDGRPSPWTPTSSVAPWGEWKDCNCPEGRDYYLEGFQLCTLPPQGSGDDISAFAFYMVCHTFGVHYCLHKANLGDQYCSDLIMCPQEYPRICGIRTQVEDPPWYVHTDDTALNNVDFFCC
ncbi:Vitelline membrane outer layer protein 1 [Folsomia candida]|uniref:Vitelline membrane outer layer protein 1 n=1 Tax=Folsomia candida TaxID=158441 RepID=A0A226DJ21_FOLCA|nr:Vitelline membrane outer layer protein 1 [Folsomia candida]